MYLPVIELAETKSLEVQDWFIQLRQSAWNKGEEAAAVAKIIEDVQGRGDRAVVQYMKQWTDVDFDIRNIRVRPDELATALRELDEELRTALKKTIHHVRSYQQYIRPADPEPFIQGGAKVGLRFTPVSSVGLIVPGGKAAYPSTVVMLAVPALAAGVSPEAISVVTPPPTRLKDDEKPRDVSPLVLAACALLGIQNVYRIGGAQGVAALAVGTESVAPVDMIVGPGNIYTQLAKLQLNGRVGIDGFYGPSEILTIADETANPVHVAADLIAQAEHDPGRCFLLAWSHKVIGQVNEAIESQLEKRARRGAIEASLRKWSAALLVPSEAVAVEMADCLAAEHVSLAVMDPNKWLGRLRHGGQFFLGDRSPVAAGDYIAGTSHCLPTGTTARFASGISVYTFLKRAGTVEYTNGVPQPVIDVAAQLAQAEGLDGHVASMRVRGKK